MNKGLLPGGEPSPPNLEELQEELESLRMQNRGLKAELREANEKLEAAQQQSASAVKALKVLRTRLEPFHLALKFVFGELDAANISADFESRVEVTGSTTAGDPGAHINRKYAYWETWEKKFGGKTGEIIRALLDHGRLNRNQVRTAIAAGWTTVDEGLRRLKGLDLIQKNGDYWTLKEKV